MSKQKKILFIVTSHSKLGDSGIATGFYLPEVAHPYHVLSKSFTIVFASPKGGKPPMDPEYPQDDLQCSEFLENSNATASLHNSIALYAVNSSDYAAIFFPGGHGPMYDLATNAVSHKLTRELYERGGVVGAVCHGPAGIVNLKLSNGQYLVQGKQVAGFSNTEEDAVDKTKYMPFLLENALKENGGIYSKAENWEEHTVVDGRLVTGQNPASSTSVAQALLKLLTVDIVIKLK